MCCLLFFIMNLRILYILVLCLCCGCDHSARFAPASDLAIRSGDLIFRRGDSKESYIVRFADSNDGFYSHCGIVVEIDSELFAVHSVPHEVPEGEIDRVKREPLAEFFRSDRAISGAVYRTSLADSDLVKVCRQAMYHFDVATPFDGQFVIDDTTELYCTEFLHHIFMKSGYDLARDYASVSPASFLYSDEILFPCDLLKNPELSLVYSF